MGILGSVDSAHPGVVADQPLTKFLFRISNFFDEKNAFKVISRPSHCFLIVIIEMPLRLPASMLYTVEGVKPDKLAGSLILMLRSWHISRNHFLISWASFQNKLLKSSA